MPGKKHSNLKNQPACEAHCKRTGLPCRQPKVNGKRVCRVHGGLSTGPKTKEGKDRIRQAKLVHGRYSKNSEERRIAIKAYKEFRKTLSLANETAKSQIKQFEVLAPYLEAYWGVDNKEVFEITNLLVFGQLNEQIKRNPTLRKLLQEFFEQLVGGHGFAILEALLDDYDRSLCARLDASDEVWQELKPDQKNEMYLNQFYLKLMDVREALSQKNPRHSD
jgi:hypothetical protein